MNKQILRIVVISCAIMTTTVYPTTYIVGPERTNKRLQDVTGKLAAGDTVNVDGNVTYTGGVQFTKAGTVANKIVVKGIRVDGKRPIISGGTNTIHFNNSHHLVFEGFEVTGGSSRGIFHQADSVIVRDIAVHDCPQQGILGADIGSGSLFLEYSEVYNCGSGSSRHQIYMTTDQVNFPGRVFRMQYCYIHDAVGGNNVKSRSERNEIYYNWIEGAFYHELELIGPDPGGVDDGWTIELKREDSDVVGNVLRKRRTAAKNDTDFAVTRCGGDATGWTNGRYRFVNNTIIAGSGAVFRLFDTLESIEMHNNIFYRTGGGVNIYRAAEGEMAWSTGAPIFAGSNNWVVTSTTNIPAQWTGTKTGANPGFMNVKDNDLRITSESACKDAGAATPNGSVGHLFPNPLPKPLFLPPVGAMLEVNKAPERQGNGTIDIGAFEFSSNAVAVQPFPAKHTHNVLMNIKRHSFGTLSISFVQPVAGAVELRMYDLAGKLLTVKKIEKLSAGSQIIKWESLFVRENCACAIELRTGGFRAAIAKVLVD